MATGGENSSNKTKIHHGTSLKVNPLDVAGIGNLRKAHQYLEKQRWFELSLSDKGVLEIIVDTGLISLTDARKEILYNTPLSTDEFTISYELSKRFLSIETEDVQCTANGQQWIYFERKFPGGETKLTACSSSGVLHNRCNPALKYLITSGHYTSVGTKYYLDADLKDYIGVCTHCCFECVESGEFVDMALVKIEKDIPRSQLCQVVKLPSAATGLMTFVPQLHKGEIQDFENKNQLLYKHGRSLIDGRFSMIREGDIKYLALITEQWRAGTCFAGESGSLITFPPRRCDCPKGPIKSVGVVAGLKTIKRKSEDGADLDSPLCVFSSIWTALKFFGLEDLENIDLCPPICCGGAVCVETFFPQPDSGYRSASSSVSSR